MTSLAQLQSARIERDAARASFDSLRDQVQSDLDARGLGTRVTDRATSAATDVFVEAIEVADTHRGIVAGTIAVLLLWFFRNPLISAIRKVLGQDNADNEEADDDRDRAEHQHT